MKKDTVDLVLRFADGNGKIRKNVTINGFIEKFDNLLLQLQNFEAKLYTIDFKLMNGIKTVIKFHLAGIIDLIKKHEANKTNSLINDDFHNKIYGLYAELLRLIDAIIIDLKSGCEYIDLISLSETIKLICALYEFAKNQQSNDLTVTQEMIIDEKLYELVTLFNGKIEAQIKYIKFFGFFLFPNMYLLNFYHSLQICRILDSTNYQLDELCKSKIECHIATINSDIDALLI